MLHEELMRGESLLSVAERELIAAYVSGLNACPYCHGVHAATARRFGVSEHVLTDLLQDVERGPDRVKDETGLSAGLEADAAADEGW